VECEDILYTVFTCPRLQQVWQSIGIVDIVNEELLDRSGSMVLEHMVLNSFLEINDIGLLKLILTSVWYIWWEGRQFTHGEDLQTVHRGTMAIGVLATNYWRPRKKPVEQKKES
jgi:hypothetical protein